MLSIHTNLSSLIAQNSLAKSTNGLNQAIERMSTGYKINHAGDNAANYSIATNYSSKISSYEIAYENTMSGLDLVATAQDTLSLMQEHGSRIHALITQAQNGTYGPESLNAINSEVAARIMEINRIYTNTQFNGIDLFKNTSSVELPDWAEELKENLAPKYDGFIANAKTYSDSEVDAMTSVSSVDGDYSSGVAYKISSAEELAKLAIDVNDGVEHEGAIFVLADDIDLASYCAAHSAEGGWTAIGNISYTFKGAFDGNGHKVSNLTINKSSASRQGLFGYAEGEIKNVGVENCNITGGYGTGGLVGHTDSSITNCYATGNVTGYDDYIGGLAGYVDDEVSVTNCFTTGSVTGNSTTGGLVGYTESSITNCYATGNVTGSGNYVGGLVGDAYSSITNCYATGNIIGSGEGIGGLVGDAYSSITNCYATGNIIGSGEGIGGLAGYAEGSITNCYATGNVTGEEWAGGLVGWMYGWNDSATTITISNCFATGNVTGNDGVGGFIGVLENDSRDAAVTINLNNIFSTGRVSGETETGSLLGIVCNLEIDNEEDFYGDINISNAQAVSQGDMIGGTYKYDCDNGYNYCPYDYDMSEWLAGITELEGSVTLSDISLQVGINSDPHSRITFNSAFSYDLSAITSGGAQGAGAYDAINTFLDTLSSQATMLGAVQNRLESAMESITVDMNNAISARSTIKDADIAEESSRYIQQQILQNAAATLLSTANQTPAIALQLI